MNNLYIIRKELLNGKKIEELPLKVTFYARVSTDKDVQINSLNNQIDYFKEYINSIKNWELTGYYVDEGISGTSTKNRISFQKMIEDAKNNKFDLILTKEISRFSRNTIDSIKYTEELLNNSVGVYFINDNINTFYPDSELRLTIMSSIYQEEVRKLSERISFGMKRSIKKGFILGSSNIYGYNKDNGKLVINKEEAELIKIIYKSYLIKNMTLNKLSYYLYNLGYKSKTNKRFDPSVLKRIIENPKYKGYYCGNKSRVINYKNKNKVILNKKEWIVYKDENIPIIIDENIWNRANKKLLKRKHKFDSNTTSSSG